MHRRKRLGNAGERLACEYLVRHGYQILHAPWQHLPYGEIDIVASDRNELVFVEVKTRRDSEFGHPEEAVTWRKRQKISWLIDQYLEQHRLVRTRHRFDVVGITWHVSGPEIVHIRSVGIAT